MKNDPQMDADTIFSDIGATIAGTTMYRTTMWGM